MGIFCFFCDDSDTGEGKPLINPVAAPLQPPSQLGVPKTPIPSPQGRGSLTLLRSPARAIGGKVTIETVEVYNIVKDILNALNRNDTVSAGVFLEKFADEAANYAEDICEGEGDWAKGKTCKEMIEFARSQYNSKTNQSDFAPPPASTSAAVANKSALLAHKPPAVGSVRATTPGLGTTPAHVLALARVPTPAPALASTPSHASGVPVPPPVIASLPAAAP